METIVGQIFKHIFKYFNIYIYSLHPIEGISCMWCYRYIAFLHFTAYHHCITSADIQSILIPHHLKCFLRRPSGVPEQDFCSFLMPYYQKQEAYMRRELKKIQAENAALAQKVQSGRESIAQTENRISATVDEWKVRQSR